MPNDIVTFEKIPINVHSRKAIYDVYHVLVNNKSKVLDDFNMLSMDTKEQIKSLIKKMATVEGYNSDKIKYNLHGYNFGEIKPKPHRFFFFKKCGKNIIFFEYKLKKTNSLGNRIYKEIDKEKKKYEEEFQRYISGRV